LSSRQLKPTWLGVMTRSYARAEVQW
jgi:hypothetical protein